MFLLSFDNGSEAIARIPSSAIVGNSYAVTASEVATMDYLRRFCGVKIPRVLAWSCAPYRKVVGTDFILMERTPGVLLADRWHLVQNDEAHHVVMNALNVELRISGTAFSQIGSLYFKGDVSPELQQRPLFLNEEDNESEPADLYRIGPSTDRLWWCGRRSRLSIHRGPCKLCATSVLTRG